MCKRDHTLYSQFFLICANTVLISPQKWNKTGQLSSNHLFRSSPGTLEKKPCGFKCFGSQVLFVYLVWDYLCPVEKNFYSGPFSVSVGQNHNRIICRAKESRNWSSQFWAMKTNDRGLLTTLVWSAFIQGALNKRKNVQSLLWCIPNPR